MNPTPWTLAGQAIRDAAGNVVVSALNPCGMKTRRLIVKAVNSYAERAARNRHAKGGVA